MRYAFFGGFVCRRVEVWVWELGGLEMVSFIFLEKGALCLSFLSIIEFVAEII
jgi:hypothetical protein